MTVLELCDLAELNDDARQAAASGLPVRTYIEQIVRAGQVRVAISALAQVLPKRDAIAWGLDSIRYVDLAMAKAGAASVVEAIEKWIVEPCDERRRATKDAAEKAGIATPAGCLGMAVFFSGGSVAPPDSLVTPEPAPNICGKMVAGAIALAVALDPRTAPERLRGFFDHGMRVANQLKIWEKEG